MSSREFLKEARIQHEGHEEMEMDLNQEARKTGTET